MSRVLALHPLSFIPPMLPQLVAAPPADAGWLHEIKNDGYRTMLVVEHGRARAFTRAGHDWSKDYAPIVEAAGALRCRSAILDGEVAVQDERGMTVFSELRQAIKRQPHRLVFFGFDLLHLDGRDLRNDPIEDRRARLAELLADADQSLQFSESFEGDGPAVFAQADAMGLEGIVSKRKGSAYKSGGSSAWQKTKTYTTGTFVVIGASKTPTGIPTALLATMSEDGPVYAGAAFVNMGSALRDEFWRYVEEHEADRPAVRMPRMAATWVQPGMVVEVKHLRGEGMLRHGSVTALQTSD